MLLLILGGLLALLVYNSAFQTFAVNTYLSSLSKKLKTTITVEKVDVSFFNEVNLQNLYVEDLNKDTLLFAENLTADIGQFSYKMKIIELEEARLTNAYFNLKKYENDTVTNLQFIIDHFKSDKKTPSSWVFALNKVKLNNIRFNYLDANKEHIPYGVDYNNLSLTNVHSSLSDINLIDKGVACKIEHLGLVEHSGFILDTLIADARVSPLGIHTENLKIVTPKSNINGEVDFETVDYKDLANFIKDVKIKSQFNSSLVSFNDISYFASALEGVDKWINFNGEIKGTIDNLKTRNFSFITDDGTRFKGKTDISGLPNMDDVFMYIDVKEFITTKERVESFPLPPFKENKRVELPDNFRHLGAVRFKGNFTGFYHDFVAYGTVKTNLGNVTTDVSLKLNNGNPHYTGKVATQKFNIGKFFDNSKTLGFITMDVNIDGEGFTVEDLNTEITGDIKKVEVKGYEYDNVVVEGKFKDQVFEGYLAAKDENIEFDFNGNINLANAIPEYHFKSNIKNAKLAKLGLVDSRKKLKTRLSTVIEVNLKGKELDNLVGDILISNTEYKDKIDTIEVEQIYINSTKLNNQRELIVKSDLLDAKVEGEFYFKEIGNFINNFFVRYIPSQIDQKHQVSNLSHNLNFNIELHNSALLSKVFFKQIQMSDHTILKGRYDASTHNLILNGESPFIDAYGFELKDISIDGIASEKVLDLSVDVPKIYVSDSIYLDNFNLKSVVQNDSVLSKLDWNNVDDVNRNEGDFTIATKFDGYQKMTNYFIDSYAYISDSLWSVRPGNLILTDTSFVMVKGLGIATEHQRILMDGRLSPNTDNQIDLLLENFNLSTLKKVIPSKYVSVNGVVNGVASISKLDSNLLFTSDLKFEKLRINESLVGDGTVEANWNNRQEKLSLNGKFYRDFRPAILFAGNYFPNEEEERLDMNLELNQAELKTLNKYTKDFIADLSGKADAKIKLEGNFSEPRFTGYIDLVNPEFRVIYLNTVYNTQKCRINIVPDMISIDNATFYSANNPFSSANVNGTVYHQWFKDLSIDIGVHAKNFMALNTTELENSLYYGKAFVSGYLDISSYQNQMIIDADIKSEPNTVINIPLSNNEEIEENKFIEFVDFDDTTSVNIQVEEDVDLSNLEMNFDMEITTDAEVRLIFDEQIGDVMRSRGTGNLAMNITNDGDLNMFGNYEVFDGDYLFTLQNVINKRFDLEQGGTIKWNGSPYDAEVDLTAVYRLRARLYDLLVGIDTSDVYKKRTPVDLKLRMKNSMMNPDISFDIGLPTADEATKNKVKSVLYVSGKDENIQELNKQVFSLLVLNSFIAPQGADAGYGHASVGATTSSELLSNQLSNWLSKISNDFDVGINYRPGDELSGQEVELALSTQLLNDRLILDGNFGVSDRSNVSSEAQNTNNLIGDISMEYKITKDGKLRAKAFNNSNQYSFQNINSPYTQGLGLSYKEEYDTGKEFWQNLFSRFKRKTKKKKVEQK